MVTFAGSAMPGSTDAMEILDKGDFHGPSSTLAAAQLMAATNASSPLTAAATGYGARTGPDGTALAPSIVAAAAAAAAHELASVPEDEQMSGSSFRRATDLSSSALSSANGSSTTAAVAGLLLSTSSVSSVDAAGANDDMGDHSLRFLTPSTSAGHTGAGLPAGEATTSAREAARSSRNSARFSQYLPADMDVFGTGGVAIAGAGSGAGSSSSGSSIIGGKHRNGGLSLAATAGAAAGPGSPVGLLKPLPGLPAGSMLHSDREQDSLPLTNGVSGHHHHHHHHHYHHSQPHSQQQQQQQQQHPSHAASISASAALDPICIPPQHIPQPLAVGSTPGAANGKASIERPTPPVPPSMLSSGSNGSFLLQSPPASARLEISQMSMSPPDADPARVLAESNRSSIDDIRRGYALRKQAYNGSAAAPAPAIAIPPPPVAPLPLATTNQHQQHGALPPFVGANGMSSPAASPASAFQTPPPSRRPGGASVDMVRPASVLETRSARHEAAQRQQLRHSISVERTGTISAAGAGNAAICGSVTPVDNRSIASSKTDRERGKDDRERRSRRTLGDYVLGKTLGAGSMGKVKLGVKMGNGEKVAIKIIPRHTSVAAAHHAAQKAALKQQQQQAKQQQQLQQAGASTSGSGVGASTVGQGGGISATAVAVGGGGSAGDHGTSTNDKPIQPSPSYLQKAYAKDQSKEIRTIREGSLQLLLHHPYVCGMREMIIHPNHYYMVFEYVNGGQMLDYIISHGRLRERAARKFARQIASALEYCHRNSVIHRDLKIENILISKTGNIKIIDFGLSNLYSPHSHLSTFCGSLYFAAPELLNAKVYTGPEVDVWSFGIVLYVLVCGKVPFDDQSMPALHAKIKRGQVEYPVWLSGECKHILSRMLVTNPQQRASLTELMSHPWMVKGYDGPPDMHMPQRTPLRAGQLDVDVIKGMTGFEFGAPEDIERHMTDILTSELYQQTLAAWDAKHGVAAPVSSYMGAGGDATFAIGRQSTRNSVTTDKSKSATKRFSGIDFYRKKANSLFGGKDDATFTPNGSSKSTTSASVQLLDPTAAYHPLFSIYYLVKEKMEREKLYGHSFFASSNISLINQNLASTGGQAAGGSSMPTAADIPQEEVKVPETSHASSRAIEPKAKPGLMAPPRAAGTAASVPSSPTPVFDSREKSQPLPNMAGPPRARATGDEMEEALRGATFMGGSAGKRPESTLMSPTKVSASTFDSNHKRSMSLSMKRPMSTIVDLKTTSSIAPSSAAQQQSISVASPTNPHSAAASPGPDHASPTPALGTLARRFGSLMSRSPSTPIDADARDKRRLQRMSTGGMSAPSRRASTFGSGLSGVAERRDGENADQGGGQKTYAEPDSAEDINAIMTKPLSPHPRDSSSLTRKETPTGTTSLGRSSGLTMSPKRRQSTLLGLKINQQQFPIANPGEAGGWQGPNNPAQAAVLPSSSRRETITKGSKEQTASKPVFLKGLFSVQTTSTKPRAVIHQTLVQVLDRLGVQYREIKGGYECVHLPSLDFSGGTIAAATGQGNVRLGGEADMGETEAFSADTASPQRPRRKGSKLSFTSAKQKLKEVSESKSSLTNADDSSIRSRTNSLAGAMDGDSSGLGLRTSPGTLVIAESNQEDAAANAPRSKTMSPNAVHDLAVRFEVFVVKVPLLLGVNGLQFRRVSGNPWQYQMLAKRILEDAKL
ncbi:Pkinase-domain-containing protein [Tilletiaria anomala UBC 951]|uniref:non-specific serine/threonine protein kinase n=1 Tax=Tilletiaria anomala (strain ATCC 24038 / CBS 436.72 / UBC 951) TaxID=1037660 RepID=A0A066W7F4_TILAU|nr:Pkinase-domain-containing protein [Tilletiaria anomala UBC 951]KDN48463.1 Pkinase-domain-containing protein [Tilletiaria anomala UBC 951]